MAFSAMDGFFLAVFLAVCILVAVVLRCICYRCCLHRCPPKPRHDSILPSRSTPAPTITPARNGNAARPSQQQYVQVEGGEGRERSFSIEGVPLPPRSRAVFTIYTFPQHDTADVIDSPPRTPGPPKYSSLPPCDLPPKYEDLFPQDDFSLPAKSPAATLSPCHTSPCQPTSNVSSDNTLRPIPPPPAYASRPVTPNNPARLSVAPASQRSRSPSPARPIDTPPS